MHTPVFRSLIFNLICVTGLGLVAQAQHEMAMPAKAPAMIEGVSNLHHPVSAANPEAQQYFDQGLRLIYAFNHDEAAAAFRHAAAVDPKLAMAWWGVAEAIGPNYNDPASEDRFRAAHEAVQKAVDLAAGSTITDNERGYIAALAVRFPADPKADVRKAAEAYRDAMRALAQRFPDDSDAAVLFAESAMNLHPWELWHKDGTPEAGTPEIVATLESVLKRDPNHIGAIHYYIHTVEASPNPDRALAAANRLAALAPAAGHLVHMPAHIYVRTGDFSDAVATNVDAARADEKYLAANPNAGMYGAMYYSHNLHFIATAGSMAGRYAQAKDAASKLYDHVAPIVKDVPPLEGFMTVRLGVLARFGKWDEILAMPQPDASLQSVTTFWHFDRGLAFAAQGKLAEAQKEYDAVAATVAATPADLVFAMPVNNKAKTVLSIARDVLGAKIAMAQHDAAKATALLRQAVATQDTLIYDEPPDWFYPVRESLGGVLLATGDAVGAEQVFRADLEVNPRNGRSLFGLREALKAQKRDYEAGLVNRQFEEAWKSADVQLSVAAL